LQNLETTLNQYWGLLNQFPELTQYFEGNIEIENFMKNPLDLTGPDLIYELHFNFCKYLEFNDTLT
jgi:hypothetical protein